MTKEKISKYLTTLSEGSTIRACMGSKKHPCGAIEVQPENTTTLISQRDYDLEELAEIGISHGILSRDCYIRHLVDDVGLLERVAEGEANKLNWKYDSCPK